jgi:3-deoxy-7-phosphoheptulonate synthase
MVESVKAILAPYKLVSRELHPHDTVVDLGGVRVGGGRFTVVAGPSRVESREALAATVAILGPAGAVALRAGTGGTRTSPYARREGTALGAELLEEVAATAGLPTVTEIFDAEDLPGLATRVSCLEVGPRQMHDHRLLSALGRTARPVLLSRGPADRVEELLLAAEYLVGEGNSQVILCERGIRTFETAMPATVDLGAVAWLKERTHLPVFVDPSHAAGHRTLVPPLALAALAAGADGLLLLVHHDPANATEGGAASLDARGFGRLVRDLRRLADALGRDMGAAGAAR